MMKGRRILIVDNEKHAARAVLIDTLQQQGCKVTTADSVPDALKLISSNTYDVLLSDLHLAGVGDGLTVVSAMRHANPKTITMVLSAFPDMSVASQAIMLQADQILVRPLDPALLVTAIEENLAGGSHSVQPVETVATILERTSELTIKNWFEHIQEDQKVMAVALTYEERTCHLPKVLSDLVARLRAFESIGGHEAVSPAAAEHGLNRRRQGYSAAMLVEESRMLQISIFHTLQMNLANIDFSILLVEVMTIADEIDSQLSQAMASFSKRGRRARVVLPRKKGKIPHVVSAV